MFDLGAYYLVRMQIIASFSCILVFKHVVSIPLVCRSVSVAQHGSHANIQHKTMGYLTKKTV